MPKVTIDLVAAAMKKHQVEPAVLRAVIEDLNIEAQPNDGEEKEPTVKKQYGVLVSDPDGVLPKHDFVAWVFQIPENENMATLQDRVNRAAYDFNASRKGRMMPVKTVGEAIECVPAKYFRQADVWVKTKTPVIVVLTDNEIPRGPKSDGDLKEDRSIDVGGAE